MNFIAQTRHEAIRQYVEQAMARRHGRAGGISRDIARRCIRKAKQIRKADDWTVPYHNTEL